MGSTCIKIPITINDINLNEEFIQEINQNKYPIKEILKMEEESVYSDDQIQLTSHSFDEIQDNLIQSEYSMNKQLDQSIKIKSILKTTTNTQYVQTSTTRKSVTFCLISPNQYKEMTNSQAKLSQAQKEFLESLYASQ